jgi:hypothetical protein
MMNSCLCVDVVGQGHKEPEFLEKNFFFENCENISKLNKIFS